MKRNLITHDWERPAQTHPWECPPDAAAFDEDIQSSEACVDNFLALLTKLYLDGSLSAQSMCVLCFWASKFHPNEELERYAMPPKKGSGKYAPHLSKVLGLLDHQKDMYRLPIAVYRRHDLERSMYDMPAIPLHEAVAKELEGDPSLVGKLQEAVREKTLPEAFFDHPVVKAHGGQAMPLALYADGVPYSHVDSAVGFWICNVLSGSRHLLLVLRKRLACHCGCKGWCSFSMIFRWLAWSIAALAAGVWPQKRHDGTDWRPEDEKRRENAGQRFKSPCCLLYIKGDWSEYCGTFGFPTWGSTMRPCLYCSCSSTSLFTYTGVSAVTFPHRENTDNDYDVAAARCEVRVRLTKAQHKRMIGLLAYDKRPSGNAGIALLADFPEQGLRTGDRLEPTDSFPDVGGIFKWTQFPLDLVFWRRSEETLVLHRNPLWNSELGVTAARTLTVDLMHTMHLGVFQSWAKVVVWMVLDSPAWVPSRGSAEEHARMSVRCMRGELDQWYKDRHAANPVEGLTRVHDLTIKMFGSRTEPKIAMSASETWGFLLFLLCALDRHSGLLPPSSSTLLAAGKELERMYTTMQQNPMVLPPAAVQAHSCAQVWFEHPLRHLGTACVFFQYLFCCGCVF